MTETNQEPTQAKKPHKPYNRQYNRKRVLALNDAGIPPALIAKDQDVAISTITRYLRKIGQEIQYVKQFNSQKADILSLSQLTNHTIEDLIKQHWMCNPDLVLSLPIKEQKDIVHTMQGGRSFDHASERLERNQSTANIAYDAPGRDDRIRQLRRLLGDADTLCQPAISASD